MSKNTSKIRSWIVGILVVGLFAVPIAVASASNSNPYSTKTETKIEYIDYKSSTVEDSTIEYGKTAVRTKGVKGEITTTYEVTYKDKKEVSRKAVKSETTKKPIDEVIAKGTKIVWRCVDVTSYDQNPYNDNKCTNSLGEFIYTYDSEAERLDPTYDAGKSGAWKYNF